MYCLVQTNETRVVSAFFWLSHFLRMLLLNPWQPLRNLCDNLIGVHISIYTVIYSCHTVKFSKTCEFIWPNLAVLVSFWHNDYQKPNLTKPWLVASDVVYFFCQVHQESAQLVSVSANLVNKVMANNPQLVKWVLYCLFWRVIGEYNSH